MRAELWRAAKEAGARCERAESRAELRSGLRAPDDPRFPAVRAKIAGCPPCVFFEWARDAASAFGDGDAARMMFEPMSAFIEGIRIADDIQDREPVCLATEIGVDRALEIEEGAYAIGMQLIADLPLRDDAWRAAAASLGRGLRETAIGQEIEAEGDREFWEVVDRKTAPLAATALEIGALAAGASPERAAALTALAIPFGRLLQIGDDCIDALSPGTVDWRTPRRNLLMLYALSGPRGAEVEELLAHGDDRERLRDAQRIIVQDGALAYALHAQAATLTGIEGMLETLALPDAEPFRRRIAKERASAARLLHRSA